MQPISLSLQILRLNFSITLAKFAPSCSGIAPHSFLRISYEMPHRSSAQNGERGPSPATPAKTVSPKPSARIAYQLYGDLASGKTPLLMLHGSLMSAESMAPMIGPFLASRPVIAIDARGHGRTGDVTGPITYERMADDVAAVARALGVKRADVLGYSMGATTALIVRCGFRSDRQTVVVSGCRRVVAGCGGAGQFSRMECEDVRGTPIASLQARVRHSGRIPGRDRQVTGSGNGGL